MDASRFDRWARALTASPSRRTIGQLVAGLLVAGPGRGVFDAPDALAKRKKHKKKKCKGDKKKCGKTCISKTACCVDTDCPTGVACISGDCVCPIGTTDCGDVCANLATDGDTCGSCGNACESGACVHGTCTCSTLDDCPASCVGCLTRVEGGKACGEVPDDVVECEEDDDCPLGSFCIDAGFGQFCSEVCQG